MEVKYEEMGSAQWLVVRTEEEHVECRGANGLG